jgi:hypothetical protein
MQKKKKKMAKRKKEERDRRTMIYITLHRKLKIEQHKPVKTGVNTGAPEG